MARQQYEEISQLKRQLLEQEQIHKATADENKQLKLELKDSEQLLYEASKQAELLQNEIQRLRGMQQAGDNIKLQGQLNQVQQQCLLY